MAEDEWTPFPPPCHTRHPGRFRGDSSGSFKAGAAGTENQLSFPSSDTASSVHSSEVLCRHGRDRLHEDPPPAAPVQGPQGSRALLDDDVSTGSEPVPLPSPAEHGEVLLEGSYAWEGGCAHCTELGSRRPGPSTACLARSTPSREGDHVLSRMPRALSASRCGSACVIQLRPLRQPGEALCGQSVFPERL